MHIKLPAPSHRKPLAPQPSFHESSYDSSASSGSSSDSSSNYSSSPANKSRPIITERTISEMHTEQNARDMRLSAPQAEADATVSMVSSSYDDQEEESSEEYGVQTSRRSNR